MNTKDFKIGFIGLGYAGFPMACLFAKKYKTVGFDISRQRIAELQMGIDHCGDVPEKDIQEMLNNGTVLTDDFEKLRDCNFFVISVPTPVDSENRPDMSFVESATQEVSSVLKKGDIVVYSSTVYPGATEEVCVPILEECTGLRYNIDFFLGYVPERINPGDKDHTLANSVSIISGSTPETLKTIEAVYSKVLGKQFIFKVSSIKTAEAAKVVENSQRDINIAFINEMAKVLSSMDIDTNEVIDAMNTKWNALGFRPGFVGGHCIGVDPYYISYKANQLGAETQIIDAARNVSNSMAEFAARKVLRALRESRGRDYGKSKVLILGFTFKENCPDVRNTKIYDLYKYLSERVEDVTIFDPWADHKTAENMYGLNIITNIRQLWKRQFDAILLCVPHKNFKNFDLKKYLSPDGFVYDFKGFFPRGNKTDISIKRL